MNNIHIIEETTDTFDALAFCPPTKRGDVVLDKDGFYVGIGRGRCRFLGREGQDWIFEPDYYAPFNGVWLAQMGGQINNVDYHDLQILYPHLERVSETWF